MRPLLTLVLLAALLAGCQKKGTPAVATQAAAKPDEVQAVPAPQPHPVAKPAEPQPAPEPEPRTLDDAACRELAKAFVNNPPAAGRKYGQARWLIDATVIEVDQSGEVVARIAPGFARIRFRRPVDADTLEPGKAFRATAVCLDCEFTSDVCRARFGDAVPSR